MNWIKRIIVSTGGILLGAALIRCSIGCGSAQALNLPDPILHIPLRVAVLTVAALEFAGAIICLRQGGIGRQLTWLMALATGGSLYISVALLTATHFQGTCLGSLTDPLQLSRGIWGMIIPVIQVYFVAGTLAATLGYLFTRRMRSQSPAPSLSPEFTKISCPRCGGHIEFPNQATGSTVPCPHCQEPLRLNRTSLMQTAGEHKATRT